MSAVPLSSTVLTSSGCPCASSCPPALTEQETGLHGFDWHETVLIQYANSPRLLALLASWCDTALNTQKAAPWFIPRVLAPRTACGWGLDVWGRIVGVNRVQRVPDNAYFGFDQERDGLDGGQPWGLAPADDTPMNLPQNRGPWYTGQGTWTPVALNDCQFRRLIFTKAAANLWDGGLQSYNALLMRAVGPASAAGLSGGGAHDEAKRIWVENTPNPLHATVRFNWRLSGIESAILFTSGAVPRPAGVKMAYVWERREN